MIRETRMCARLRAHVCARAHACERVHVRACVSARVSEIQMYTYASYYAHIAAHIHTRVMGSLWSIGSIKL